MKALTENTVIPYCLTVFSVNLENLNLVEREKNRLSYRKYRNLSRDYGISVNPCGDPGR